MRARSRNARSVISTRYAMLTAERFQRFPRRPDAAFSHILAALPDAFLGVCLGCDIEQTLIGCGVLHHRRGLAVDRQHHWPFGFLELLKHRRGMVPKRCQSLDVPCDVHCRCSLITIPLKVLCHVGDSSTTIVGGFVSVYAADRYFHVMPW